MKKYKYLILDTETAGSIASPLVYDIAWAICDRQGNIETEKRFCVSEIFLGQQEIMNSCYYSEKIPAYWDEIRSRELKVKSLADICRTMKKDIKEYGVNRIGAYNASFDRRALNNTVEFTTNGKYKNFLPKNYKWMCVMHMACQVLLNRASYYKFAERNNLTTEKGNLSTTAEACYRYMTGDINFIESHTALQDVKIEVEILASCFRTHQKMLQGIKGNAWSIPNKGYKEWKK